MIPIAPQEFEIDEVNSSAVWAPLQEIGRYRLLSLLGRGGMGEVWLARIHGPQDFVKLFAIKRVVATLADDIDTVSMLAEEARLCAMLQHQNIVPIFEFGEHAGVAFFAMEFVSGEHLGLILKELESDPFHFPQYHRVAIIKDIASALSYAHTLKDPLGKPLNLVHRDVSPSNIMVTPEGQVKLLDFGVARADSRRYETQGGRIKGKIHYMSMEQLSGKPIDGRADQFSLGIVFAEFLAGRRSQEMSLVDTSPAGFVSELLGALPSETPPELRSIIQRMLCINAAERFDSMEDVEFALRKWLDSSPRPSVSLPQVLREGMKRQIKRREEMLDFIQRQMATSQYPSPSAPGAATGVTRTRPMELGMTQDKLASGSRSHSQVTAMSVSYEASKIELAQNRRRSAYIIAALVLAIGLLILAFFAQPSTLPTPVPTVAEVTPAVVVPKDTALTKPLEKPLNPTVPSINGTTTGAGLKPSEGVKNTPTAKAPGQLTLQTKPWTRVYWGSRLLGETPLTNYNLPQGHYKLRLVNEESSISTTVDVDIESKKKTVKRLDL